MLLICRFFGSAFEEKYTALSNPGNGGTGSGAVHTANIEQESPFGFDFGLGCGVCRCVDGSHRILLLLDVAGTD